jgi:hypothetical protein
MRRAELAGRHAKSIDEIHRRSRRVEMADRARRLDIRILEGKIAHEFSNPLPKSQRSLILSVFGDAEAFAGCA